MYNTRSSAKNRSVNTGNIPYSLRKAATSKKQTKVKKVCQHLGAVRDKTRQGGATNTKICSQRLTVSPSFFSKGIKSRTVRKKTAGNTNLNEENLKLLNEDLHGLLQSAEDLIEVNKRPKLKKDDLSSQIPNFLVDSFDNYNICNRLSECNTNPHNFSNFSKVITELNSNYDNRGNQEVQNESKSLFKEINERYEQLFVDTNSAALLKNKEERNLANRRACNSTPLVNFYSCFQNNVNANFCHRLREQVKLPPREASAKQQVLSKIDIIVNLLKKKDSNPTLTKMAENRLNKCSMEENDENAFLQLVPPSSWVFRTPNDQKLKQTPVEEMIDLKPAILQTSEDTKVLYEIDENVARHVNLENYAVQKRMVPINLSIARPVCEVNIGQDNPDEKFYHCRNKENWHDFLKTTGISNDDCSFKIPVPKQHRPLRDSTNLVREVTDPKRHGTVVSTNAASPFKKDIRAHYTQRPMKSIKKSSRSFKKPPKKLTFDFESKRQKMSLFEASFHEKTELFNLDESQEAFNEGFTFIKNDGGMELDCTMTESYFSKDAAVATSTATMTIGDINPLNISDVDMECCYEMSSTTQKLNENERCSAAAFASCSNLCDSEVSYNFNEHFLCNFPKITETPTLKFYPRPSYDGE